MPLNPPRTFWLLLLLFAYLTAANVYAATPKNAYFTAAEIAAIRARAAAAEHQSERAATRATASLLADLTDEEIWALVPQAESPRAINVRFGTDCPVHGAEVFKVGGHYPWIMSADKPYKLECPVGHEVYPSNDYAAFLKAGRKETLDTTQKYVDDGFGWIGPEGKPYFFVGYYAFWQVWRNAILGGSEACGKMYLATGDEKYAHKAAVCLARLAQVYPQLDWNKQGVSDGKYPSGWTGRMNDRIWENLALVALAKTYEVIRPTLAGDDALHRFAADRGVPDVARAIERDILQVGAADIMAGKIHGNKFELGALSTIALVLQNDDPAHGATTKQMVDWILTGGGELEFTFYNGFDRDGIGGESSPMYSSIWNDRFVETAHNLARLGVDVTRERKWLRIAKGPGELRILDGMIPRIGDHPGGLKGDRLGHLPRLLRFGVEHFDDPECAAGLRETLEQTRRAAPAPPSTRPKVGVSPFTSERLFLRETVSPEKLEHLAASAAFPKPPYTRNLGGYGLAILEMVDSGGTKRAATMYYGGVEAAHQHRDRLTLGYFVRDREVLTEMGYPSHWGDTASYWWQNTPSHYCVMIDEQAHSTRAAGHLTAFADLPGLKLASADALAAWGPPPPKPRGDEPENRPAPPPVKAYQRTVALLDTRDGRTLLVDAFLAAGGRTHDYSFHGLPYGNFRCDLKLISRQDKGTLAGVDVAFGQDPGDGRKFGGYQYLMNPARYEPDEVTHLSWTGDDGLDQHTWFPRLAIDEVIVADTTPPVKPGYPTTMPYVLLRNQDDGGDLTSLFLSITDVDKGPTNVKTVRRLTASSPAAGGAVIKLSSGDTWRIYCNESGGEVRYDDGATGSARFVAVQMADDRPALIQRIGPGTFAASDLAPLEQRPIEMKVVAVDYRHNKVTIDRPVPTTLPAHGLVVVARTGPNAQSDTIRSADGATLGFGEVGLITGRFKCAWDSSKGKLVAQERTGGFYNQFAGKSFIGMTAVSEDFSTTATITGYDRKANTFTIDADAESAAKFTDADGDGRPYVYIADIAVGTTLIATPAQTVSPAH